MGDEVQFARGFTEDWSPEEEQRHLEEAREHSARKKGQQDDRVLDEDISELFKARPETSNKKEKS